MSRAFVKEPDGDQAGDDQPDLPISEHPNYVTKTGLEELQFRRNELATALEENRSEEDGPEAHLHKAQIEREIRYLHARIESAVLIEPDKDAGDKVEFGATVTVEDEEGEVAEYSIVGEDEADASKNKVSYVSPLAKSLLGAEIGDSVTWVRPNGNIELEIIKIRNN